MTDQSSLTGVSESEWMRTITDAAVKLGWDWLHIGRVGKYQANGAKGTLGRGWPDLLLVKGGRLLFIECKLDGELLQAEQVAVFEKLRYAGEYHILRPSDLAFALDVLA